MVIRLDNRTTSRCTHTQIICHPYYMDTHIIQGVCDNGTHYMDTFVFHSELFHRIIGIKDLKNDFFFVEYNILIKLFLYKIFILNTKI